MSSSDLWSCESRRRRGERGVVRRRPQDQTRAIAHALTCRALELSESWFYKWRKRPSPRQQRRAELDAAVKRSFEASDGDYGSPRVREDLRAWRWRVSKKSVAASMARQ